MSVEALNRWTVANRPDLSGLISDFEGATGIKWTSRDELDATCAQWLEALKAQAAPKPMTISFAGGGYLTGEVRTNLPSYVRFPRGDGAEEVSSEWVRTRDFGTGVTVSDGTLSSVGEAPLPESARTRLSALMPTQSDSAASRAAHRMWAQMMAAIDEPTTKPAVNGIGRVA